MKSLSAVMRNIFQAALRAVDPAKTIACNLELQEERLTVKSPGTGGTFAWDLRRFNRLSVFGAGKASAAMAAACEKILGPRVRQGLVITKYGHGRKLKKIELLEAGHPLPDAAGEKGARTLLRLLAGSRPDDLILFLTSGGCSALLPAPAPPVSLRDKQKLTGLLLRSGADIREINTVRKHLSLSKGGQLARAAFPASVINLVISDVVGDNLDIIGSGPFVADPSTFREAWSVLDKYGLIRLAPAPIIKRLKNGLEGKVSETPKPGDPCFRQVRNFILASNRQALLAASEKARSLGFKPLILTSQLEGDAGTLAKLYGALAREVRQSGHPAKPPVCLLAGGEPTVVVKGRGRGGRNMELALAVAREIRGLPETGFLSGGTDGTDGPTEAAGALVDGRTVEGALKKGLSAEGFLAKNDSYRFFQEAGGLLVTGPTGTNVMDVHILLLS